MKLSSKSIFRKFVHLVPGVYYYLKWGDYVLIWAPLTKYKCLKRLVLSLRLLKPLSNLKYEGQSVAKKEAKHRQHSLFFYKPLLDIVKCFLLQTILPCINVCTELPAENRFRLDWNLEKNVLQGYSMAKQTSQTCPCQYRSLENT